MGVCVAEGDGSGVAVEAGTSAVFPQAVNRVITMIDARIAAVIFFIFHTSFAYF
jgi:hypothetical protein